MAPERDRVVGPIDEEPGGLDGAVGRVFGDRYRIVASFKRRRGFETFLGIDLADGSEVVVKAVSGVGPEVEALLEQEADVLRRLRSPVSAHLLDMGRAGGLLYIVLPYVPGLTLEERLAAGPLAVRDALVVARSLMQALEEAHEHGALHRDVKPANVIVEERDGELARAVLIDFGFAQLTRVSHAIDEPRLGTARYASPEVAGMIAQEPDGRSDLYSAGVVLFECLVGRPPFLGDTVGEVLRAHLSQPAPALRSLGLAVPRALDEVIQRLLRKDPADRYTSAGAALADLDEIAGALDRGEAEPPIVVGGSDHRRTLTEPAFVGRTEELETLKAEFEEVRAGHGRLVLLEAESGGGKTRLLEELARQTGESGTWVLRGQAVDQVAQRPFQLLDGLVDEVLARVRRDSRLAEQVAGHLGHRRQAVCDALPQLAEVLGAASAESLGPEAYGEARSLPALAALIDALGRVAGPVIVLLDDCQWADELTLKLLGHWSARGTEEARGPALVVVAFRTGEVAAGHPLRKLLPSTHVVLTAFGADDLRRVLTSMAGALPDEAVEVVERLSEGNPFMATAVLRGLVESGALVDSPSGWRVQPDAMTGVQTSRHAAAFLARRLELLPRAARRLLTVGAVLGKEFDRDLAASLAAQSRAETAAAVEEARRRQILWTQDGRCIFVHDKLREALLRQLPAGERRELHRQAALAIQAEDPERVFELAYHFDAAGASDLALPYALAASEGARARHALEIAEHQYRIAARGAATADQSTRQRVAEGLGQVLMLRGRYDDAERELEAARSLAQSDVHRAEIDGRLGELAFKRGDVQTASAAVERALRLLGRWVPRRRAALLLAAMWEVLVQVTHTLLPGVLLGRRDLAHAESDLMSARLYTRLAYIYWFQRGRVPCLWAHLREMNLVERYPPTAELAQAYSEHAPVMTMVPYFRRGIHYAERSLAIRKSLGDVWGQGQSLHFYGVVLYSASRFAECIEKCREAIALLERTGDRWEMNTAEWHIAFSQYRLGDLAAAVESSRRLHTAGLAIGDHQASAISLGAWAKATSGRVPADLVEAELARSSADVHTTAEILQAEALRLLREGRPGDAGAALQRARELVRQKGLKQEYVAPVLPWLATALRVQLEQTPTWSPEWKALMRRARAAARSGRRLANSYRNNLPHALREDALLSAMRGRSRRARKLLDESLRVAGEQGALWEQAQSLLARGQTGLHLGWEGAADDLADGQRVTTQLTSPLEDEAAQVPGGEVTLSLLDRFDGLLEAGHRIASALTRDAIYSAVREASVALLRGERSTVVEVEQEEGHLRLTTVAGGDDGYSRVLVERAVDRGGPVLLDNALGEDAGDSLLLEGVRSALCAPIFSRGRLVAALHVTHEQVGALFGEEEGRLAEFITTLAGSALENAQGFAEVESLSRSLEKRVEERTAELAEANRQVVHHTEAVTLLQAVAVAANRASTIEDAMQVAVDEICRYTRWPVGHVWLLAEDGSGDLVPSDVWHLEDRPRFEAFRALTERFRFAPGAWLPGRVLVSGKPAFIPDIRLDKNFQRSQMGTDTGVLAGFAFPLLVGEEVVGVLEFFSPDPSVGDQPQIEVMAQVGTELGRVVERKRSEEAIRASEERTRSIVAAATEAFVAMDGSGSVTEWNRSAELMFGWRREEAIGRPVADIIPPRYRQAHWQGLDDFLTTGRAVLFDRRMEMSAVHRDGHEFPVELSVWHTQHGNTHSFNAFIQDITTRKQTEMELGVARDQALDASRLKSQFLATMSHEIRTPMNALIGFIGLLLGTDLDPTQRDYAESVQGAGEALLGVIDDILDFSKIESGKLDLEELEFDLQHVIEEAIQLVGEKAHAKGLEIVGYCEPDVPRALVGDPGRLRQILLNLTSNAVKFTREGEVVVRAELRGVGADGRVTVRLEVSDTGMGVAPEQRQRLFEPFSQADASTTRRYGGTGLGLAISKQLTEAMGGTLTLESEPGRGSTFVATIPLGTPGDGLGRATGGSSRPDPRVATPAAQGRGQILVVEDNDLNQNVLVRILNKLGYGSEVVGNGRQAVDAVGQKRYAAVLMDCHMPEMDGYQATAEIRRLEAEARHTPIIALTASALAEDRDSCLAAGMDDYIPKPFRIDRLRDALSQWVRG